MVEKTKPILDAMVRQHMLSLGLDPEDKKDIEKFWFCHNRLKEWSITGR
jgi:hypothetical protein|tara:strand:+ start:759 stop:905 length:147 start_codon:yes stop_codon:yes gene_type:complete